MSNTETPIESAAARKIVELAQQDRQGPLYVVGLGTATNIASAILLDPTIKDRIVVVWIGGHPYHFDNALDFNLKQDVTAAQVLFNTDVPLVHIPAGEVAEKLAITLREFGGATSLLSLVTNRRKIVSYFDSFTNEAYRQLPARREISIAAWPDSQQRIRIGNRNTVNFWNVGST
ncbi:nucleoside hydrolase [Stieleria maiorica]|uniref:nucleoside hydrolase n=1 Tax=Stieleria maiorica TaxID=2795974 RepID=UPI0011C7B9DF|nr:nucleoside hydrolase [Stieleria maiorica]